MVEETHFLIRAPQDIETFQAPVWDINSILSTYHSLVVKKILIRYVNLKVTCDIFASKNSYWPYPVTFYAKGRDLWWGIYNVPTVCSFTLTGIAVVVSGTTSTHVWSICLWRGEKSNSYTIQHFTVNQFNKLVGRTLAFHTDNLGSIRQKILTPWDKNFSSNIFTCRTDILCFLLAAIKVYIPTAFWLL